MKTIDVKNQPKLSLRRTFEISINGIRYRLFRSAVTMVVIAVAIAFMMNVMCEAVSYQAMGRQARARTAEQRLAARWTVRLSAVGSQEAILGELAAAAAGDALFAEAGKMGGLKAAEVTALHERAAKAVGYLTFFDDIGYARRRVLVRNAAGTAIFDRLQDGAALAEFAEALRKVKSISFPGSVEQFRDFLSAWPALKQQIAAILEGRTAATATVVKALDGRSMFEALAEADGPFGQTVFDAGFSSFDVATRGVVARQARELRLMRLIEERGQETAMRKAIAARLNALPGDINTKVLWQLLRSRSAAEWYLGKLPEKELPSGGLTADRLVELAREKGDQTAWDEALRLTGEVHGGFMGIGSRMTWLVLVSLLVCAVGISNAMLMTVTERFREIATLKCLGALDGFIMTLFLLEACLLGLVGGLLGGLGGSLIGFGRMLAVFGGMLFAAFPLLPWVAALIMAMGVGVVLAAVAGVYPSYIAARLAPMEAMRIE